MRHTRILSSQISSSPLSLTFDDVLLKPIRSNLYSRKNVSLKTRFSKNITLHKPIISSNMDTVTEDTMAIAMAKNGGLGIIHRYLSVNDQVEQIKRVKRAEGFIIETPYTLEEEEPISSLDKIHKTGVKSVLVTKNGKLSGIVTNRDLRFLDSENLKLKDVMTKTVKYYNTKTFPITVERAKQLIHEYRVEKLPLVDENMKIVGLVTAKDLYYYINNPYSSHDASHRFMVGAAIGVKNNDIDRALALVEAGADCIIIDIAHGHSELMMRQLTTLRKLIKVDIVAGNVATAEGALELIDNGADSVKVGIGPGSICTTRIVTGCGVPQLSAILEVSSAIRHLNVPIIADGGIKNSGDIVKALAAGADTVMLGSLLAGTDESPGKILIKNGKKVKIVRGMAGYGANNSKNLNEGGKDDIFDLVPEGVEGQVPYRGKVKDILHQLCGGLSSGISYCGATTISEMQQNAQFIRVSPLSLKESGSRVEQV